MALSGSGIAGTKVSEIFDNIVDGEKEDGSEVSDAKELAIGDIKAREYYLVKNKVYRRMALFASVPRVFAVTVSSADKSKLDDNLAKTFLTSAVLTPKEVLEAEAKERVAKAAELDKEMLKKYGACWTLDPKEFKIPDASVVGLVGGKEFKPESATISGRSLNFQVGKPPFYDQEMSITLPVKAKESLEEKKFKFGPADIKAGSSPTIAVSWMPEKANVPKRLTFSQKYNLQLAFEKKNDAGEIPGTIYLSVPETTRSFMAGKFVAKEK
jgi:hypothetical protein